MSMLQSLADLLVPVVSLAAVYFAWRKHQMKDGLRSSINAWEKQLEQTEILHAIEEAHANYMVEQDFDEKFEIARLRIRERVEAASKGRPSSELTSPSGIRRQREKIDRLRAKLNVPDPL